MSCVAEESPGYGTRGKNQDSGRCENGRSIVVREAREHNSEEHLRIDIPRDQMVIITGLSGSGKSTLAFDILFAEGQRRFLDSMSAYARQFVEQLEKPRRGQHHRASSQRRH